MKQNANKETQHTPGPWEINEIQRTAGRSILGPDKEILASAFNRPLSESEANARLIAAAPELLEACRNAANVLAALATGQLREVKRDSAALLELRAAIARATGSEVQK